MKIATAIAALALVSAPSLVMAAPGSCERVKSDIEQRIINNGVPADNLRSLSFLTTRPISRTHRWWAIARTTRIKFFIPAPAAAMRQPIPLPLRTVHPPNRNNLLLPSGSGG
ncbi:hypothetical protein SEEE2558_22026 [Salmonella enterica subsp. enterica serovar Enteritidis str. 22558]|nr:hypothetical protein SEEE2558_22026 [Salmonella enterica subsp. enterica serovar Enteritidis str. 22558]